MDEFLSGKYTIPGLNDLPANKKPTGNEPLHKSDITEPAAKLAKEHKRLVAVLRSPDHDDDEAEAERQEAELAEYEKAK